MRFEWDPAKAESNRVKHGVAFETVREFVFTTALIIEDARRDYGETRVSALGLVGNRVFHLLYTMRGDRLRVISLCKANAREARKYVQAIDANQGRLGRGAPPGFEEP